MFSDLMHHRNAKQDQMLDTPGLKMQIMLKSCVIISCINKEKHDYSKF